MRGFDCSNLDTTVAISILYLSGIVNGTIGQLDACYKRPLTESRIDDIEQDLVLLDECAQDYWHRGYETIAEELRAYMDRYSLWFACARSEYWAGVV